MTQNSNPPTDQTVGYYNVLYNLYNKDNEENVLSQTPSGSLNEDNIFSTSSSGPFVFDSGKTSGEPLVSGVGNPAEEESVLNEHMIERAVIQFFDNGKDELQRYKLKIRLNLKDDKTNPEFIANLTKDWSNFKKYIPAECKDDIKQQVAELRQHFKNQTGIWPYVGKFHFNQGKKEGKTRTYNQIEPWSWAVVYYDTEEAVWRYCIRLHDWED